MYVFLSKYGIVNCGHSNIYVIIFVYIGFCNYICIHRVLHVYYKLDFRSYHILLTISTDVDYRVQSFELDIINFYLKLYSLLVLWTLASNFFQRFIYFNLFFF